MKKVVTGTMEEWKELKEELKDLKKEVKAIRRCIEKVVMWELRGWRRERGRKEIGGEQGCRKGEQGGGNKEGSGKRRCRDRRIIGERKWN